MTEPNVHALTGAYVLDALDADEAATFRAHLDTCQECRQEVATLTATVTRLAVGTAVTPPPGLLGAVLAQVGRTPQAAPQVGSTTVADPPVSRPTPPVPIASRRRARSRWPAVAAAAAVVIGIAAGGTLVYRDRQADQAVTAMQSEVMRIVSAPDAVTHDLDLGATHVVMSTEMSKAALMGEEVPMPTANGMVYQVWMLHADGSAAPGPTFMPHDGEVMTVVEGDLSAVTALTVTVEPDGGSATPTGEPVATVVL